MTGFVDKSQTQSDLHWRLKFGEENPKTGKNSIFEPRTKFTGSFKSAVHSNGRSS